MWSADGSAVFFSASERGHRPAFRVDVETGATTRPTRSGAFDPLQPSPDGTVVYAIRSAVDAPPAPVRLDARAGDQDAELLRGPVDAPDLPGSLVEISATADDGQSWSWLVLPADASEQQPAPLLLLVHGGPEYSWMEWSWRWCPWPFGGPAGTPRCCRIRRFRPATALTSSGVATPRGATARTDLMTITDAAEKRPDIDATRSAALGGSFGGHMANWVAGHN